MFAVRFLHTESGQGLACFRGSAVYGDELGSRCKAQDGPLMNVRTVLLVSLASCKSSKRVRRFVALTPDVTDVLFGFVQFFVDLGDEFEAFRRAVSCPLGEGHGEKMHSACYRRV
jgi:hypothetical protein